MDLGVAAQPHHVAPALAALKPAEQFSAGKAAIGQHGDGTKPGEQPVSLLQQGDHHLSADAGTGMLKRLPEQRSRPTVADNQEHHHADAVPQHRGVEGQTQGLAWLLPLLNRPERQRAVEALGINPPIAQPPPAASLPAGRKATVQRD